MLGLSFSSKLDWGSYIVSIAKTPSEKSGTLIQSIKFLSPEVTLYLYKSTIRSCVEYCYRLQKRVCRTVGLSLAGPLGRLAHHGMQQVDVHLNWLNWFHFLVPQGGPFVILLGCMTLLSLFQDHLRMSMSTISFLAQLDFGILYVQNAFV